MSQRKSTPVMKLLKIRDLLIEPFSFTIPGSLWYEQHQKSVYVVRYWDSKVVRWVNTRKIDLVLIVYGCTRRRRLVFTRLSWSKVTSRHWEEGHTWLPFFWTSDSLREKAQDFWWPKPIRLYYPSNSLSESWSLVRCERPGSSVWCPTVETTSWTLNSGPI